MKKARKILVPTLALGMVVGTTGFAANATSKVVEPGDTLWSIGQEYDVAVESLMGWNSGIDPYSLQIGSEINVAESTSDDGVTHTVQPGNTLWQIADMYDGVTVDHLMELNPEIDPAALVVGSHVVVVDQTTSNEYIYHTIQPGNTFTEIASVYDGVSVADIRAANPTLNERDLTVGATVAIPINE